MVVVMVVVAHRRWPGAGRCGGPGRRFHLGPALSWDFPNRDVPLDCVDMVWLGLFIRSNY